MSRPGLIGTYYYEAFWELESDWWFKVYHFEIGYRLVVDHKRGGFSSEAEALDAAVDWAEDNGIEVQLG